MASLAEIKSRNFTLNLKRGTWLMRTDATIGGRLSFVVDTPKAKSVFFCY